MGPQCVSVSVCVFLVLYSVFHITQSLENMILDQHTEFIRTRSVCVCAYTVCYAFYASFSLKAGTGGVECSHCVVTLSDHYKKGRVDSLQSN